MSYQSAAELQKAYHELIISSFGRETDSWVFERGGVKKLVDIERAHIRLKTAQMREKIQAACAQRAQEVGPGGEVGDVSQAGR